MPMFHCHLHLFCNTLNLKLKLRWIFTSFQNASNSADLLILWQALTWSSFCPWQINTKRIDWVLSGVCGGKNKRKKKCSKSFKELLWICLSDDDEKSLFCSFLVLSLLFHSVCWVFYWRKKRLVQIVLSSRKPELHKQHALKTSEDTWPPPWKVSVRQKCSFTQCLEREAEQWMFWRSMLRHTVNLHYGRFFYDIQHFRARSLTVRVKLTTYLTKQHFQTAPVLLPNQGKAHTCLSKKKSIKKHGTNVFTIIGELKACISV